MSTAVTAIQAAMMRTADLDLVARFGEDCGRAVDVIADQFCTSSSREVLTRWFALSEAEKADLGALVGRQLLKDRLGGGDE
jgi:hypothetical protein